MLQPGTKIGSYEIIEPLASGGMGVVYRARHTTFGDEVALKVLLANLAMKEKVRRRFQAEAYVQHQLKHPNIVSVKDFVDQDGHMAIVMEWIRGPSLQGLLEERPGAWSEQDAQGIMRPLVSALAYAHTREAVHRDLKPANVLLKPTPQGDFVPKVTDFGLVKVLSDTSGMTREGAVMGTVPYMAPEQFKAASKIDSRADVFSLGMMALRLVSGGLPVNPDNMMEVAQYYAGQHPQSDLPGDFGKAILAALSLELDGRPKDARAWGAMIGASDDIQVWTPTWSGFDAKDYGQESKSASSGLSQDEPKGSEDSDNWWSVNDTGSGSATGSATGSVDEIVDASLFDFESPSPAAVTDPEIQSSVLDAVEATDPEVQVESIPPEPVEATDPDLGSALIEIEQSVDAALGEDVPDQPEASEPAPSPPTPQESPDSDLDLEDYRPATKKKMYQVLAVLILAAGAGFFYYKSLGLSKEEIAANTAAEEAIALVKEHKTISTFNSGELGQAKVADAVRKAQEAVEHYATPSALAAKALVDVLNHKWHVNEEWWESAVYFEEDDRLSQEALAKEKSAPAYVARVSFLLSICGMKKEAGPMVSETMPPGLHAACGGIEQVLSDAKAYRLEEKADEESAESTWDWLWFEMQWQELRYRTRVIISARKQGNHSVAQTALNKAVLLCNQPDVSPLNSPVNDYEFYKDCARMSGWNQDYGGYFTHIRNMLNEIMVDEPVLSGHLDNTVDRHRRALHFMVGGAHLACLDAHRDDLPRKQSNVYSYSKRTKSKKSGLNRENVNFCVAASLAAVGCYTQASDFWWSGSIRRSKSPTALPWNALGAVIANQTAPQACFLDSRTQSPKDAWKGWSDAKGRRTPSKIGADFVRIPAGSFRMGSSSQTGATPHQVTLTHSFLMSKTEITRDQYRQIRFSSPSNSDWCYGSDCPVQNVSWYDAVRFANALSDKESLPRCYQVSGTSVSWVGGRYGCRGYRLPTEAEWEYAARANTSNKYAGSNSLYSYGWSRDNAGESTQRVATKNPNAWGLFDMSGNVFEWVWDAYSTFSSSSQTDPYGGYGTNRVMRGGGWSNNSYDSALTVYGRSQFGPSSKYSDVGFRIVRTVD